MVKVDEGHGPGRLLGKVTMTVEIYADRPSVILVARKIDGARKHVAPSTELCFLFETYAKKVLGVWRVRKRANG